MISFKVNQSVLSSNFCVSILTKSIMSSIKSFIKTHVSKLIFENLSIDEEFNPFFKDSRIIDILYIKILRGVLNSWEIEDSSKVWNLLMALVSSISHIAVVSVKRWKYAL